MLTLVYWLNTLMSWITDAVQVPFSFLPPFWSLTAVSLVTGLFMLWIFGMVSNQDAIKRAKNIIGANLIAVRIYQNDLRVFLAIQKKIFAKTFVYMKYSLKPMLVMLVPVILLLIQLQWRYGVRGIEPGERVLVKATVADPSLLDSAGGVRLGGGGGVVVETGGVRIPAENQIVWRVRVETPGEHTLTIQTPRASAEKRLITKGESRVLAPVRMGSGALDLLLYPGEPPLDPSAGIERIEVAYPEIDVGVFGWEMHWLIPFFVLSIAFGYAFKGFFGIQI